MRGGDSRKSSDAAHPLNSHPDRGGEEQDHQEQVAETLQQRQREDVEADIIAEGMIADVKRHAMKRLQIDVPCSGLAVGGQDREHCRAHQHQDSPWNPIAEGAQQLGQIDLGHLIGTAHHAQPLAIARAGPIAAKPLAAIATNATSHTPAKIATCAPTIRSKTARYPSDANHRNRPGRYRPRRE